MAVGRLCDDARERRFADPGRTVKDHVRQLARKYNISQRLALAEQMSLTDDIVDSLWAHSLRQRC